MIPTVRLVWFAAFPALFALTAAFVPAAILPMLGIDLALIVVSALDAVFTRGAVEVARHSPPIQAVGRPFQVTLEVQNVGSRDLSLRITDDAPGAAEGLPASLALGRGQRANVSYPLLIDRRGEHPFGPVSVRFRSPLGLWERQQRFSVPGGVRVYPDFAQLRSYGLQAREAEQRLPVRTRRRPGGENEFERLRPYVAGDPYRHIDWRATARRGDFVSREFGQEVNQNLILLIDAGRMMSGSNGALTSFDHALNAALMMGQVALRHGDRVGLLVFDKEVRVWLPPKGGARAGSRLIRATYDVFPTLHEPDYALAFRHLSHHVRRRSLVVLITSVVDEVNAEMTETLVGALSTRHLPLCVWLRDSDVDALADAKATSPGDPYVRAAAAELLTWRERSLAELRRRGALVVDAPPSALTPRLLNQYLEIKARRLL